jgi:hypothetical protein
MRNAAELFSVAAFVATSSKTPPVVVMLVVPNVKAALSPMDVPPDPPQPCRAIHPEPAGGVGVQRRIVAVGACA